MRAAQKCTGQINYPHCALLPRKSRASASDISTATRCQRRAGELELSNIYRSRAGSRNSVCHAPRCIIAATRKCKTCRGLRRNTNVTQTARSLLCCLARRARKRRLSALVDSHWNARRSIFQPIFYLLPHPDCVFIYCHRWCNVYTARARAAAGTPRKSQQPRVRNRAAPRCEEINPARTHPANERAPNSERRYPPASTAFPDAERKSPSLRAARYSILRYASHISRINPLSAIVSRAQQPLHY